MMMNKTKSPASRVVKYLVVLPFFFLLITANSVYGGNHGDQTDVSIAQDGQFLPEPPPLKVTDEVFGEVENLPEYPGGNSAMIKLLSDNIRYPVIALENGIQGRIVCSFIITKDGSISNVNVLRGVDPSLDAEVVRIINMMDVWKPGTQDGNKVNVQAVLPVVFRVQRDGFQEQVLSDEDRLALAKRELDDLSAMGGKFLLDELVIVGYAPGADKDPVVAQQTPKKAPDADDIFVVVEEQPYFPGGNAAMLEFMSTHIKYPVEAQQNGVQGRVICNFVVRKDGSLTDINVVRSVDPLLDAEAVRLIGEMPKWVPGKQRGQVVNVRFTLPIVFRLDKTKKLNNCLYYLVLESFLDMNNQSAIALYHINLFLKSWEASNRKLPVISFALKKSILMRKIVVCIEENVAAESKYYRAAEFRLRCYRKNSFSRNCS